MTDYRGRVPRIHFGEKVAVFTDTPETAVVLSREQWKRFEQLQVMVCSRSVFCKAGLALTIRGEADAMNAVPASAHPCAQSLAALSLSWAKLMAHVRVTLRVLAAQSSVSGTPDSGPNCL